MCIMETMDPDAILADFLTIRQQELEAMPWKRYCRYMLGLRAHNRPWFEFYIKLCNRFTEKTNKQWAEEFENDPLPGYPGLETRR